jgi:DNA-directed RNA polymerase subunit RPC12/RpoP
MTTVSYKCPNCGGGLQFNPELQKSKCEYCLSEFSGAELDEISSNTEKDGDHSNLKGYVCNSCGAEVVTEETTSATFCYYCHNPVLLTGRLTGEFKPTKIIPFTYDKDKAVASLLSWVKSKWFVPKEFYSTSQLEKITGVYVPYWMADVKADIDYSGVGTNIRIWRTGNTEYTEHREYRIQRQGVIEVDNIHEIALRKINKGLLDSISPYDESKAVDFSMSYLSGFFAEKYDIQKDEVQPSIEDRAAEYASTLVNETIGSYNRRSIDRSDVNISIKGWNYTLLPAWILTYIYNGKTYIYAVNGQTGKSYGELPVDRKKLGMTSGIIAAALFAFAIVGGLLIW